MKAAMNREEHLSSRPMHLRRQTISLVSLMLGGLLFLAGCGSGKVSVKGYDAAMLNGKRVFVLLPAAEQIVLENPSAFAQSRGIGDAGAPDRIATEFRTDFPTALDSRIDSNTILEYRSQTVGAVVPLNPAIDLPMNATASWQWDKVKDASRQGNIDYLLVIHQIRVQNELPKGDAARGKESVTINFALVDPEQQKVMTTNEVTISVKDPRRPVDTYVRLSEELSKKLPFHSAQ